MNKLLHNTTFRIMAIVIAALLCILIIFGAVKGCSGTTTETHSASTQESSSTGYGLLPAVPLTPEDTSPASETPVPEAPVPEVPQAGEVPAEAPTGEAVTKPMEQEMLLSCADIGWHFNDLGRWYSPESGICYCSGWKDIDGQRYHFDDYGHASLGWKLIDGQTCYFDDNGVYIPGADNSKLLAFTFDDGPSQGMDQLLELCQQTGARVTFFMIGKQVEGGGGVIPYITKYRCQLGSHSYDHANMDTKTPEECAADFAQANELIKYYSGGIEPEVVRFPYGNINDANVAAVGKPSIFWDVDTFDWDTQDKDSIINEVVNGISEGNIILMHDRYDATVEACQYLFPYLIDQGYQLVTISELAAAKGIDLQGGVTYYNFRG